MNNLTTGKFEQIKLYLLGNLSSSKPQLDALFLSETFLKPIVPDSLYAVSGCSIYQNDRKSKSDGGVIAFINHDLAYMLNGAAILKIKMSNHFG